VEIRQGVGLITVAPHLFVVRPHLLIPGDDAERSPHDRFHLPAAHPDAEGREAGLAVRLRVDGPEPEGRLVDE
jgi:hypothetical protein